jgi:hypothetical protein
MTTRTDAPRYAESEMRPFPSSMTNMLGKKYRFCVKYKT